jgi:hypothetical protein
MKRPFLYKTLFVCILVASCKLKEEKLKEQEIWAQKLDITQNMLLDSIYKRQQYVCDSLEKNKLPLLVDSIIKANTVK